MKVLRRMYSFLFVRCEACGKRLPVDIRYCSSVCEELEHFRRSIS